MSRVLLAFAVAQLLDLVTYLRAPHLEANPLVAGVDVERVCAAKLLAIALAAALVVASRRWRGRAAHQLLEAALLFGIGLGAFGAGTNVATLSIVTAAEAPRSAPEPAPTREDRAGIEQDAVPAPVTPGRAEAPAAPGDVVRAVPRGTASWYCCTRGFDRGDLVAAAGPALRRALGAGWRGSVVRVVAGRRAVTVRLVDWCQCFRGEAREVLVDLHPAAFRELAPLSAGVVDVRVELVR